MMRDNRLPDRIPELLDKSVVIMNTKLGVWCMRVFILRISIMKHSHMIRK